ncbi:hypothetical protein C4571_02485 [Candidatus Parcubacteria bacterium]|nr:MAG: hypothetical protein C4571_02485 [Candidatus Parcubacteria bacterium]
MQKSNTVLIAVGILVFIGAAALLIWKKPFSRPVNTTTNVTAEKLPEKFPVDVPLEEGAKILKNYNSVSPEGRVQASRVFESNRSVAANFDLYRNFLTDRQNGWTVVYELNNPSQPAYKAIFARRTDGVLNVTIRSSTQERASIVDVSFLASESN